MQTRPDYDPLESLIEQVNRVKPSAAVSGDRV